MGSHSLADKRALVTGGASGIGEACCRMFAAAGAFVVIADNNATAGEKLVQDLVTNGISLKACFIQVDVTSWQSQIDLITKSLDFFPGRELDILVTSAGVAGSPSWELNAAPPDSLPHAAPLTPPSTQCLDVGLLGSMYSTHIAAKYAMGLHNQATKTSEKYHKSIILVGSMAGHRYIPGRPDYTVQKWGVRGLFRSLRQELFSVGVRVNLIAPTWVPTPMIAGRLASLEERGVKTANMDEVTLAVKRLATERDMIGRALCISSEGIEDMCDDLEGFDGGKVHSKLVSASSLPSIRHLAIPEIQ